MFKKPRQLSLLTLLIIALVSVFFAGQLPRLEFAHELEAFFPADVAETEAFYQFRKQFGSENDYLLIGIRNEGSVFDSTFLAKVDAFGQDLAALPQIAWVLSPTRIRQLRRRPLQARLSGPPFLHIDQPERYAEDSTRVYEDPLLVDFLFSHDRRSLMVYAQNTAMPDAATCQAVADSVEHLLAQYEFTETHTAGKCLGQTYYLRLIEQEIIWFTAIALAMIALFLWLSYRTFWAVWLPLLVVGLTVLWTTGIMVLAGRKIDIISHIIPTILLVIGVANLVHLLTHFLAIRRKQANILKALGHSIRMVGPATVMTTLTTAFGFLTLSTSSFVPLEGLGIFSTIGLFIALFLSYTLAPAVLCLLRTHTRETDGRFSWDRPLERSFDWILRHRKAIVAISAILLFATGIMAPNLRINRHVLDDFKPTHPQRQHFDFFAASFGGARSFELQVRLRDSTMRFTDPEVLKELDRVDTYLRDHYGVGNLVSPVVAFKLANQSYRYGNSRYFRLPRNQDDAEDLFSLIRQQPKDITPFNLFSKDGREARITGKMGDLGGFAVKQLNADFYTFIKRETSLLTYHLTGTLHLIDLNNELMVYNVLGGLAVAVLLIGFLFAARMRSPVMVLITLVVNVLPLLCVSGIMYLLDIDLKISTAIIFVISFGIAVDDSIHFLSRFRREVKHRPVQEALRQTYLSTGKAIILTSLILCSGFLTLCLSDFLSTFYIGFLISLTLFFALLADMLLLPALIIQFYQPFSHD